MCFVAPASAAGSPEFKELICTQGGNELTGQLRHGSPRLHQLQPAVDTPPVAHPLHAEPALCWIEEVEAQYRLVTGVTLLQVSQLLGETRSRQAGYTQLTDHSLVIGTNSLVDFDPVLLDGNPVP